MTRNILVLGGTTEGRVLANHLGKTGLTATISLAGRVATPAALPIPTRVGGFGGADGLVDYIASNKVTHVVDATHPFAAQMSMNADRACRALNTPLARLTRPAWSQVDGDSWIHVPDIAGAVDTLDRPSARVFLAIGRMHLSAFAHCTQHHFVLRLVDPPNKVVPFPKANVIVAKGPFTVDNDIRLLHDHNIDLVVAKNSGGNGAYAKIVAARALNIPVVMIDRPILPQATEMSNVADVMAWLDHDAETDRGV